MTTTCRAVLFDLDDTLLDNDMAKRSGIDRLLVRHPQVDRVAALEAWNTAYRKYHARYLAGELTLEQSKVARIRSWAERLLMPVRTSTELAWFDDYLAGCKAGWIAYSDATACLQALAGLRLGIITNGDGKQQRAKLVTIGLAKHFEVVIVSGDVGCAKPDPRIFRIAAAQLRLSPGQCLYVGDRFDNDIQGALAAGMHAVWLNRKARRASDDLIQEITTLAELTSMVLPVPDQGKVDLQDPELNCLSALRVCQGSRG
jgi:putative hydrolase of the HAD superfamily